MLPALGEHPVTNLDVKHPTLAVILPQVDQELKTVLMRGWWFNTFRYPLSPDAEGRIELPQDCLDFIPDDPNVQASVRPQTGLLFNGSTLSYVWTQSVPGTITLLLPFEDLPESAANLVFYQALVTCYLSDIGVEKELQAWSLRVTDSNALVERDHLRNRKYSARASRRYQNLLRARRA